METLLENFIATQTKQNEQFRQQLVESKQQHQTTREAIKQLASKFDNLTNHTRMLKTQIAQVASSSSRASSRFPDQLETKPNEHCNVAILRSGKVLEEPKIRRVKTVQGMKRLKPFGCHLKEERIGNNLKEKVKNLILQPK